MTAGLQCQADEWYPTGSTDYSFKNAVIIRVYQHIKICQITNRL